MASDTSLSVKLPKEGVPTPILIGFAAIIAAGTGFAISDRTLIEESALERRSSQRIIASPPALGFGTQELVPQAQALPLEFAFEPDPVVNSAATSNVIPFVEESVASPSPAQPQLQNVPVDNFTSPAAQAAPEFVPPPFGPSAALVVDRGVRRQPQGGNAIGNDAVVQPNADFETLRLQPPNPSATVLRSGSLIPAVLETAIDTSQPGEARAMVSENVLASSGTDVLIPKGSRLVGEYLISANQRQKRVVVNWSRLILPDGYQVRFDFPTTDKSGASGVPGRVRSNAVGRVLSAVLQSALNIVTFRAANAGRDDSILVAIPAGAAGSAQALVPQPDSQRRITVKAGAKINVLVEQDIDFAR